MVTTLKTLFFILFFPIIIFPQSQNIKFEHISVEQGLSNNIVYSIIQDCRGFMWFGTQDGWKLCWSDKDNNKLFKSN